MLVYSSFFLFGLFDQVRQVPQGGILHEEVEIVFIVVEHSRDKFHDVRMVQRSQDANLVNCVLAFVFTHSKTADLYLSRFTFFTANFY
jgi:hypothetical protein